MKFNQNWFVLLSAIEADDQHTEPELTNQDDDNEINLENPSPRDIIKYCEGFMNVRNKLEAYIDPWNELPLHLAKYGIMIPDEADEFDCASPQSTPQISTAIYRCLKRDSNNCIPILKALIEDDQTHIAKFIASSGKNIRSLDRVLTKEEREAIDRNMFCLEKLVSTRDNDLLVLLVAQKCITPTHKDWIISYKKDNKDVYHLFEIVKRRSFQHFTDFKSCLEGTGQNLTVEVLRKGGVVEITNHLKGIESRTDLDTIEIGIIEKNSGNVGQQKRQQTQ